MRIALYTPFKPLNHPRLSGDVTLFQDVIGFFHSRGHETEVVSHFSSEWLHLRPWNWPGAWLAFRRMVRRVEGFRPDCWFTYHTYYKSPDLFGPWAAARSIPYCILSGAYASKRRRRLKTRPGYSLNKRALAAADALFTNKHSDFERLGQVFDQDRTHYMRPGISTADFEPSPEAGGALRRELNIGAGETVAVCVAMLRPGTKSLGVEWIITTLAALEPAVRPVLLVAGEGPERKRLTALAEKHIPGKARFLGLVRRTELPRVYSAGDFFVFPGINEGLGLVYLEAQCCGLPAVAWDHGGAKEVIAHEESGFITPSFDRAAFGKILERMCTDGAMRTGMGEAAIRHVHTKHELHRNYLEMERIMLDLVKERGRGDRGDG